MKRKLLVLSILMLTAPLAYSQRIQVEGTDTVAVVPIEMIRNANVLFLERDSLQGELDQAAILIAKKDSAIITARQLDVLMQDKNKKKDNRIDFLESTVKRKDKEVKSIKIKSFLSNSFSIAILLLLLLI